MEGVETGFSTMEIFYLLQIARLDGFCFLHFARCPDDTSLFQKEFTSVINTGKKKNIRVGFGWNVIYPIVMIAISLLYQYDHLYGDDDRHHLH